MLEGWTESDGTEIVEIGSGMFVIIVIFLLGCLAAAMWFWPQMSPQMQRRFLRLLPFIPYCFTLPDDELEVSTSGHSEMSSTHSTTPFTKSHTSGHYATSPNPSHLAPTKLDSQRTASDYSTSIPPQQPISQPPPLSSQNGERHFQKNVHVTPKHNVTSGGSSVKVDSDMYKNSRGNPNFVTQAPPKAPPMSNSLSTGTPLKVKSPPPIAPLRNVQNHIAPPTSMQSQQPEGYVTHSNISNRDKVSKANKGSSSGSRYSGKYTGSL